MRRSRARAASASRRPSTRGTREPASRFGSRHDHAPAGTRRPPEPDFIAFWTAGAWTIGNFACAAGALDEPLETFIPELDAWHQEDLVSTAGLARGVVLGLVLALLPLAIGLGMYVLLR